jgi:hypothetical protein
MTPPQANCGNPIKLDYATPLLQAQIRWRRTVAATAAINAALAAALILGAIQAIQFHPVAWILCLGAFAASYCILFFQCCTMTQRGMSVPIWISLWTGIVGMGFMAYVVGSAIVLGI